MLLCSRLCCRGPGRRSGRAQAVWSARDRKSDAELIKAAHQYSEAVNSGTDEEEVVASIMGAKDSNTMSEVQQTYRDKIKDRIAQKAAELEAKEEAGREEFNFGVSLYERGRYRESESMLRTALRVAGPYTKLGGDIQIQLALAMAANNKEEECIDMFKDLEENHPVRAVQRQAEQLRFIMEAPKLEIGEDEKVQVPVMNLDSNKSKSGRRAPTRGGAATVSKPKVKKSFEDEFWENYSPPNYARNKYVIAAAVILSFVSAIYSLYYKDCIPQ